MGMFDKDKEIGLILTSHMAEREEFILWDASILRDDFPTTLGHASQVGLEVSRMTGPRERFTVTTLASAIAAKVREAEVTDFPAVVYWAGIYSDKWQRKVTVLQFVRPYTGPGQEAPGQNQGTGFTPTRQESAPVGDDDIPF
jgi:hypothetical protein